MICVAMMDGVKDGEQDIVEDETQHNLAFFLEKVEGCSVSWSLLCCLHFFETSSVPTSPFTYTELVFLLDVITSKMNSNITCTCEKKEEKVLFVPPFNGTRR